MNKKKNIIISITIIFLTVILLLHIPRSFSSLTKNSNDLIWEVQFADHLLELTADEKQELIIILEPVYFIRKWIVIPRGGWEYAIRIHTSDGERVSSFVNHNDYITIEGKQYYSSNFDFNLYNEFMERILDKHKIYRYKPKNS